MVNMWMLRAGENAFLIDDFKKLNKIAIGWKVQDLSDKNPDEIKEIMENKYPKSSKTSLALNSAQVIKFVCDFQIGDYVISYDGKTRKYLVGIITSDYYFSDIFSKKFNENTEFYCHIRDVEWIGETIRDDLSSNSAKSLNSIMTIFNIQNSTKNDILYQMNIDKIEWTDFYMEFADKLLEYKDDRKSLIVKIQNVYDDLGMDLPKLEADENGNQIIPSDIDPFTVFALFNKQISAESRINIVNQLKKEFLLKSDAPFTFHGIAVVNNLKSTFYRFEYDRGNNDIDNLWKLFEIVINFSIDKRDEFIKYFNQVLTQYAVRWNITMALNWVRPFIFINLDENNRNILSSDDIFTAEFKNEIKSLKNPPSAQQYLHICDECLNTIKNTDKYSNFPQLSHSAYLSKLNSDDGKSEEGIGDEDVKTINYWMYSPGEGATMWDKFYKDGIMAIGWPGTDDLKSYAKKEEIKFKLQEINNDQASHKNDVHALWQFANEIKIGDVIFAKKGMEDVIGVGIVESDYEFNLTYDKHYHHTRKVNWIKNGNWHYNEGKLPTKTLTDITVYTHFVDNIKKLVGEIDEPQEESYPEYSIDKFLDEVYIDENDYNTLVNLLLNKKNLIVEGAPGVGKTYLAKRLAYSIMGEKNVERVMMVQFHQSYSYEDFVMGYRPVESGFELKMGSFYKFCKKAEEDSDNDYFFIIDEINRGNLSKIFGELFMLIENDKRGSKNKIQLLYSDESFFIPKNVHIIGLMNTADRSLAMIDYALRRRFAFFDLKPGFDSQGFKSYQNELSDENFDKLVLALKELNEEIKNDESLGEGFRIGHSYLCNLKNAEKLDFIVEYELIPLLREYWFDEADKVRLWSDRLRSVIND